MPTFAAARATPDSPSLVQCKNTHISKQRDLLMELDVMGQDSQIGKWPGDNSQSY